MNGRDDRTRDEGRRGELDVQEVNRAATQFDGERERDANEGRVRQSPAHGDMRPAPRETLDRRPLRDIERIAIHRTERGQCFDQIRDVSLVAGQTSADRVGVNRDVQEVRRSRSPGARC